MKTCLLMTVLILFSSCSIFDSNSNSSVELDRPWELVHFVDSGGDELPMYNYEIHTLRFKENEILGVAACNYYGGEYRAFKNGRISIDEVAVTEALCRQPSVGEEFVEALVRVKKFNRKGGKLELFFGEDGKLTFLERFE